VDRDPLPAIITEDTFQAAAVARAAGTALDRRGFRIRVSL
jgi:hypothetical protein